jgi:hypothetical protein
MIGHHVGICKRLHYVTDENIDIEAKDRKKPTKDSNKIFIPKVDGRILHGKEKENVNEAIIVGSDKTVPANPITISSSPNEETNHFETVNLEATTDKTKPTNFAPILSLSQHNKFALLNNNPEGDSSSSKQPSIQKSTDMQVTQRKSNDKRIEVIPAVVFKEQDRFLEVELSDNCLKTLAASGEADDASSQVSFIDATQEMHDKSSTDGDQDFSDKTPDNVKKDMVFLNESWANMVENEEEDTSLNQAPSQPVENFQVVLSKGQKRAQKKLNTSSKDSYATRSKVSQKPFK